MANAGSFGAAAGGADNITAALGRRGLSVPVIDQRTAGAVGSTPQPQAGSIEGVAGPSQAQPKRPDSETMIITKALTNRLKRLGEAEKPAPVQPLI